MVFLSAEHCCCSLALNKVLGFIDFQVSLFRGVLSADVTPRWFLTRRSNGGGLARIIDLPCQLEKLLKQGDLEKERVCRFSTAWFRLKRGMLK